MLKTIVITLLSLSLIAICHAMGDQPQDSSISNKISSELFQLATADDPDRFAEIHGITLIGNSVKIIIIIENSAIDFLDRYELKEIKERKNLVEAIVPVKSLISLSEEEDVSYIRRPRKFWF